MMATVKQNAIAGILQDRRAARIENFGLSEYGRILERQTRLRAARLRDETPDVWLYGEHPFVITQGVRGREEDLNIESNLADGVEIFAIDRGGMTTLHSPGQLIVYPIVRVNGGSLAAGKFAHALLELMQGWLAHEFGIQAESIPRRPGLYIGGDKLLSIGISVRDGISMHGIALNMSNDLALWKTIIPCGDPSTRYTSVSAILEKVIEPKACIESFGAYLARIAEYEDLSIAEI
jgi:lipoate-protein ligase B